MKIFTFLTFALTLWLLIGIFIPDIFSQSGKPTATIEVTTTTTEYHYNDLILLHSIPDYLRPQVNNLLIRRDSIWLMESFFQMLTDNRKGVIEQIPIRKTTKTTYKIYLPEKKVFTRGKRKVRRK